MSSPTVFHFEEEKDKKTFFPNLMHVLKESLKLSPDVEMKMGGGEESVRVVFTLAAEIVKFCPKREVKKGVGARKSPSFFIFLPDFFTNSS